MVGLRRWIRCNLIVFEDSFSIIQMQKWSIILHNLRWHSSSSDVIFYGLLAMADPGELQYTTIRVYSHATVIWVSVPSVGYGCWFVKSIQGCRFEVTKFEVLMFVNQLNILNFYQFILKRIAFLGYQYCIWARILKLWKCVSIII